MRIVRGRLMLVLYILFLENVFLNKNDGHLAGQPQNLIDVERARLQTIRLQGATANLRLPARLHALQVRGASLLLPASNSCT
jgi:hypothetical protein